MSLAPPTAAEVVAAREAVQVHLGVGVTAAQDWCADAIHVKRRAWQYYEAGRPMLLGLWELLRIKLERTGIDGKMIGLVVAA